MHKPLSLRKNFIWIFIGNAFSAFCGWLLLIILTKIGNVGVVGTYAVAQAICLPISVIMSLQLVIVQITDIQEEYQFCHYYTLKLFTAILAIVLSSIIGIVFYSTDIALIIIAMSINYAVIDVRRIFVAILQKSEHMYYVSISTILQGLLTSAFFGAIFWATQNLLLCIAGSTVARLIVGWFYDMPVIRKVCNFTNIKKISFSSWSTIWKLGKAAAPLGLVGWFQTLFASMPRLILDRRFGKDEVGYFAAITSLLVLGTMAISALSQVVGPRLAKYFFENRRAYKLLLAKVLAISIVLGIIGIVLSLIFGRLLLTIVFKPEYARYTDLLVWTAVSGAVLFVFTFLNCGLNAARKFGVQIPIYGGAAIINIFLAFLLIPKFGMNGAVCAITGCYGFGLLTSAFFLKRAMAEPCIVSEPVDDKSF